jgi:NTE family protein
MTYKQIGLSLVALLAVARAGCASFDVADTRPLPPGKLEPPGATGISSGGYRLEALAPSAAAPDLLVIVAMSGGGKRSAAFGYGALKGMREVIVSTPAGARPLLQEVSGISGVSGGSFPAAYYGLYRDAAFGQFEGDFLYRDTNSYIWGIYLLPWNWTWLVNPSVGTNDFMDRVYDHTMFHGAKYSDLQKQGPPVIAVGATDVSYGTPFLFTQEIFDLICSDLDSFPLSRAVAASNGFPGLFSPITLTNHVSECGGREPGWLRSISPAVRQDALSRVAVEARMADRYVTPGRTRYVHLVDGGVSDNLALRAAGGLMQVATAKELGARGLTKVRRVLVLSIDGEGGQDTSISERKSVGGILALLSSVTGAQIDAYNFETLNAVGGQLQDFAHTIREARCAQARVIDGTLCSDVKAELIHLSLRNLPESPNKSQLLAIPTGLTIAHDDVDLLVQAGQDTITGSEALRQFLADYPPEPLPATKPARGASLQASSRQ